MLDEDSAVRPVEVALDQEVTAGGAAARLAKALSFPTLASKDSVSSLLGSALNGVFIRFNCSMKVDLERAQAGKAHH